MLEVDNKPRRSYKMKKTVIIGSLLAVFLLMMVPTVAAEEAKVAHTAAMSPNFIENQITTLEGLKEKFMDDPSPQIFLITLAILLLKLLRWIVAITGGVVLLIILRILGKNNSTAVF